MKKMTIFLSIFLLFLFFFSGCEKKDNVNNPAAQPDILFDSQVHDFGEIPQHSKVSHIFKFKNTGDKELIITKVRQTCGCTATMLTKKSLLPGEEGEIKTEFSTGRYKKAVSKAIHVHTNVPDKKQISLTIKAIVVPMLVFEPERISVRNMSYNEKRTVQINVKKGILKNFEIKNIRTNTPLIEAGWTDVLPNVSEDSDLKYRILLTIDSTGMKHNIQNGNIDVIVVAGQEEKVIPLNFSINIKPNIVVRPNSITMSINRKNAFSKTIEIFSENKLFKIKKIKLQNGNFRYKLSEVIPGKNYVIIVFREDLGNQNLIQDSLIIKTDDKYQHSIKIPIKLMLK